MFRSMYPRLMVPALVAGLAAAALAAPAHAADGTARIRPFQCYTGSLIVNGGFEAPTVPTGNNWFQTPGGGAVGWQTDDPSGQVEIWGPNMGVTPFQGSQFAEINANAIDTLYQDVPTVPGTWLFWRLAHRARDVTPGLDVDTMEVVAGPPSGSLTPIRPAGQFLPAIASGDNRWHVRVGAYHVPIGQTMTRFGFRSLSGNPPSYGNLLDGVSVIGLICPTPNHRHPHAGGRG
jgi:hypothetical protein